jgi:hypothetical protein
MKGLNNTVTLNPFAQCPEGNFTYPEFLKYSNLNSLSFKAIENKSNNDAWMLIENPPDGDWGVEFMKTHFFYFSDYSAISECILPGS